MFGRTWQETLHKLLVGRSMRCPNCEQGKIFRKGFEINETCPYCGVRFERQQGESVGAMYLTLGLTSIVTILGYFIVSALFHPPWIPHLIAWVVIIVLFSLWNYRPSRGVWIAIVYLTGGVYKDPDYDREYSAAGSSTAPLPGTTGDATNGHYHADS